MGELIPFWIAIQEANKVLMMIGTNDSGGIGVDPAAFKVNVETIAGVIDGVMANKSGWLKYLPTNIDANPGTL